MFKLFIYLFILETRVELYEKDLWKQRKTHHFKMLHLHLNEDMTKIRGKTAYLECSIFVD